MAVERATETASWRLSNKTRLASRANRALIKLHLVRNIVSARSSPDDCALLGCYNTSNVGDLALGWTIRRVAQEYSLPVNLVSYTAVRAFPTPRKMIIGGGAVLPRHAATIAGLASLHPDLALNSAAIGLGVGGRLDHNALSTAFVDFAKRMPFFSVRSDHDRAEVANIIGREDIAVYPDVAFALATAFQVDFNRITRHERTLGISVLPFFMKQRLDRIVAVDRAPHWAPDRHFPNLTARRSRLGPEFISMIRQVIDEYHRMGWRVRHIPFSIEDDAFARAVLSDLPIEFVGFRPDPLHVLKQIASCSRVIATRFHAHVFALASSTPLLSFGYDVKCESLWKELSLSDASQVRRDDFADDAMRAARLLVDENPVVLGCERRRLLETDALRGVTDGIEYLSGPGGL